LFDGVFGVWFGNNDYAYVTWTLSVELWATFFVFMLAQTVVNYSNRWILYLTVILFLYMPRIAEDLDFINYQFRTSHNTSYIDTNLRAYIPYFTYGVIFADMENLRGSIPLDYLRELPYKYKVPLNCFLAFLFLSYGSMTMTETCAHRGNDCWYQEQVTFHTGHKTFWFFTTIGTLAGFTLALTSGALQWVLASSPF
jgi:hypothetical protein